MIAVPMVFRSAREDRAASTGDDGILGRDGQHCPRPTRGNGDELRAAVSDASTDDIAGWNEDGTAICVHKPAIFAKSLLPRYFKHNKCDAAAGLRICPPPPHPRMRHARSTGLDPSSSSSIFMTSNERPACRTSTRPLFGATRCSSAVKQIS